MATELDLENKADDESSRKYCWQCDFVTRMHMTKCIVCDAPLYDRPKHNLRSQKQISSQSNGKRQQLNKTTVLFRFLLLAGAISASIGFINYWKRSENSTVPSTGPAQVEVLGDTFLGYSTLWNQQFKRKLKDAEITLGYTDQLDQKTRSQQLSSGEVDFMVTTINQLFETPSTGKIVALWDWRLPA